jgi:hypothetical protein
MEANHHLEQVGTLPTSRRQLAGRRAAAAFARARAAGAATAAACGLAAAAAIWGAAV